MIDKEKRAHDYAKILLASDRCFDGSEHLAREAWELVDAMQAEADKRKVVGVPDAIQESRSLTKDKDGNCLHFHHEFGHRRCMDCGASLKAWQPDWSQAPDWANWWAVDGSEQAYWYSLKPRLNNYQNDFREYDGANNNAPSFDYKGDWRDSLRERPEGKR